MDKPRSRKKPGGGEPEEGSPNVFGEVDAHLDEFASPRRGAEAREETADVEDLRRSYTIIETLLNVSASINSTLNLQELLRKIVDAVVRITDCDRGYLMLTEDDGKLTLALARMRNGVELTPNGFVVSQSVVQHVAASGEPMYVSDASEEESLKDQKSIIDLNISTVICIPLKFENKLVGVIYADSGRVSDRFSPSDLSIMNAFGAQAAVAIDNARRHGELESIKNSLEKQNITLRQELAKKGEQFGMVGRSRQMQQIFDVIKKVAPLSTTVLLQGETGTGKELIAKAIHYNSTRKLKKIVSINCGALPKDILESELFGYKKGAFTGADQDQPGLFESADGGTLFLDEIGEMPRELQVKLLRALQEGEVRRIGEDQSRPVDVRVISATNKDLASEVDQGNFRKDLFYRLNVVPIQIPPLRDRREDILPLAEFFLDKFSKEMKRSKPMLSRPAKELLLNNSWVGNVRELENAIERALALGEGKSTLIDVDQFQHLVGERGELSVPAGDTSLKSMLVVWEKEMIRKMLVRNSWNVTKTATVLQISRQQLHNKIKRFGLNPEI